MQALITLAGITFELPSGRALFQNLNISLDAKLTALVGPNGIGKTSLARIISGELEATSGKIHRKNEVTFLSQREIATSITVEEYLSTRYSWSLPGEKLLEGIRRDISCEQLSGGQWIRVRLARMTTDHFLILDEPTNDLDLKSKKILLSFLREHVYGALIISHDRECLSLCEDILEFSNRGLSKYGDGWKNYEETKEHERANLRSHLDRAKKERDEALVERYTLIEKQEKKNKRGNEKASKGGMPKVLLGRRKQKAEVSLGKVSSSTLQKSQDKVRAAFEAYDEIKIDPIMYAELTGQEIPSQKVVAEAHNFNIKFHDWIYAEDLNFQWKGNLRLAIKGENGSGKSTLLMAILGQNFLQRGELRTSSLRTLYIDQKCSNLIDSKSILENVREVSNLNDREIRNGLAKLLFYDDSVFQEVRNLSGGERLRAALACGLLGQERPELLILDEPTNNLDLGNIRFLEILVSQFKGALIIISHDADFLKACGVQQDILLSGV
jgi:ATPase subunit of ABC transporter with duplicated ATPase domains